MATVNGWWHGPYTISVDRLIELLKQAPEKSSVIVNVSHLSIVELNSEEWFQSTPIAVIDFTTEEYEITKPFEFKSISDNDTE